MKTTLETSEEDVKITLVSGGEDTPVLSRLDVFREVLINPAAISKVGDDIAHSFMIKNGSAEKETYSRIGLRKC